MREHQPVTQIMEIPDVKTKFSDLVAAVSRDETRVLIEKDGVLVAALVSATDLSRLRQLDRAWDERTKANESFSQAFAEVPTEEAEAQVARIIAEHRQRRQADAERQPA
jgi:prevent-host-death family protein